MQVCSANPHKAAAGFSPAWSSFRSIARTGTRFRRPTLIVGISPRAAAA